MTSDVVTPVSLEILASVEIEADPATVWTSLIDDVGAWWPHSFSDDPKISLEPWVGGRFLEEFGEGGGALYAVVTYLEPGKVLRVSGAMGMPGARQYVKTYRLEPNGTGTTVSTEASMLGDIDPDRRESYRSGGVELLAALKRFVESGGTAR